ncbi:MAG TPA: hypothetical protein VLS93_15105, partial [Anaeromyxobacteraceae bacterium]|nr:hypothetical protein [Anaeromyxobacteraceae bacterium]
MAEVRPTASAGAAAGEARVVTGFELRLERGGAYVRLADQPIVPGLRLGVVVLAVPEVKFPFDIGLGSGQFRHRLCDLVQIEVSAEPDLALSAAAGADLAALGIQDLQIAFRAGFAEVAGRVAAGPAFTLKLGLVAEGEQGIALAFHSPRLYAPAPLAAASLPHLAARALA